jgi:hypothetical protein
VEAMTPDLFQNIGGTLVAANAFATAHKCSSGTSQSRPFPARPVKREESAGHMIGPRLRASDSDSRSKLLTSDSGQSFDGETYVPELDRTRLKAQLIRIRELMRDGRKRTLAEIAQITGDPESSVSARLRDLRKIKFGMWTVTRSRRVGGLWEYQLGGKGF